MEIGSPTSFYHWVSRLRHFQTGKLPAWLEDTISLGEYLIGIWNVAQAKADGNHVECPSRKRECHCIGLDEFNIFTQPGFANLCFCMCEHVLVKI